MASGLLPRTLQPPPDLPADSGISDKLSTYLRTFSLWCRHGFADKLSISTAAPGLLLQSYDTPPPPAVYMVEVNHAGTLMLAPAALGGGDLGAPVPVGSGLFMPLSGGTITGPITPTGGVVGVTNGSNAAAGQVGEVISSNVASPGVTLTNATPANVTSISLTAGDWDVSGEVWLVCGTGGATAIVACIALTSAAFPLSGVNQSRAQLVAALTSANVLGLRTCRISLASPATCYLIAQMNFPSGTCTAYGSLIARRAR